MRKPVITFPGAAAACAVASLFLGCSGQPARREGASAVERVDSDLSSQRSEGASPEHLHRLTAKFARSGEGWLVVTGTHEGRGWAGAMAVWHCQEPKGIGDGAFEVIQVTSHRGAADAAPTSSDSEWPNFMAQFFGVAPQLLPDSSAPSENVQAKVTEDGCRIRAADARWLEPASPEVARLGLARCRAVVEQLAGRWCPEMRIAVQWEGADSDRIRSAFFDWKSWKRCEVVSTEDRYESRISEEGGEVTPTRKGEIFVWEQVYTDAESSILEIKALVECGMWIRI